jgi:hypothetical protein
MEGVPVSPPYRSVTRVSARTGTAAAIPTVASISLGRSALKATLVTSPTRMPLKRTSDPTDSPGTGAWKTTR